MRATRCCDTAAAPEIRPFRDDDISRRALFLSTVISADWAGNNTDDASTPLILLPPPDIACWLSRWYAAASRDTAFRRAAFTSATRRYHDTMMIYDAVYRMDASLTLR